MADKKTSAKTAQGARSDMAKARLSALLIRPRFTEKAVAQNAQRVYTFEVHSKATKNEIKKAIETIFNVVPVKVATQVMRPRSTTVRGRKGTVKGMKKAMVYLKEGDVINFV